jgi:hypothetical protein
MLFSRSRGQSGHRWKFVRIGGVDQVVVRSGADIIHLPELDQKLWVALACPANHVEFDSRTLQLLDLDKDGRLRATEIMAASQWIKNIFKDPSELLQGTDTVPLAGINDSTPAGAELLAASRRILKNLGKESAPSISLGDITDTPKIFFAASSNGDGVIPPEAAGEDTATGQVIKDIIATQGSVQDRCGKRGINLAKLEKFMAEALALTQWEDQSKADPAILPLRDSTASAFESLMKVRAKIDDFFTRCQLASFDPRSTQSLNGSEAEFAAISRNVLSVSSDEVAQLPLARIEPGCALPLVTRLNPAWKGAVARFKAEVAGPLLGADHETLREEEWRALQSRFAPFQKWFASKPILPVEKLGLPRLREVLASDAQRKITELIQREAALEVAADHFLLVEKMIRIHRDFFRLLNNFVSFSDFYGRRGAIFQAGTLYLDARSCDLCVHVADTAKHAALAGLAKAYLAYCDCTRVGSPKMTIAAAFTAGDSDQLMVGRNGVFYDRQGRDWDATITKIIENPISIRQAFWSPYKKFVRMIEEQVAKRAAAADTAAQNRLSSTAADLANIDHTIHTTGAPAKPAPKKMDVGTVAAIGVALGSLATFLGVMVTKFIDLGWWIPLALVGLMFAISGPSVLIAWLKLRQRNLGPILDANGWAVNGRMKINVPFGGALSKMPVLPAGSELQLADPFAEKHGKRNFVIALLVVLGILLAAWRFGFLNPVLPPRLQTHAPKAVLKVVPEKQPNPQ